MGWWCFTNLHQSCCFFGQSRNHNNRTNVNKSAVSEIKPSKLRSLMLSALHHCYPGLIPVTFIVLSVMSVEHHHRGGGKLGPTCGKGHLQLDQACLSFRNDLNPQEKFIFEAQSTECYECSFWIISDDVTNGTWIPVNTTYGTNWKLSSSNGTEICPTSNFHFGQYGVYQLNSTSCQLTTDVDPSNPYLPILWVFLFFFFLRLVWSLCKVTVKNPTVRQFIMKIRMSGRSSSGLIIPEEDNESQEERSPRKRRVRSLDAFRGLAIVIMIFVNYGGGGYSFFAHARWNGLTVADLVFPWFMWIMGVSMVLSTQSQLRNSVSRPKLMLSILRRSATLFFLGLVINSIGGHNDLRTFRIPGVLQRFGLAYLIVGLLQATFAQRELPTLSDQHVEENTIPFWWAFRDIKACLFQWFIMACIVVFHTLLTFYLPVPGCPTGYLGPGGLHENGTFFNCTGGSARYVDIVLFGRSHIYQSPTSRIIYGNTEPYDPEGFLGTLSASFIVFLGVQCGYTMLGFSNQWKSTVTRWLSWSAVLGGFAGALCGLSKEGGLIPLNKNLWTLSFNLALGSMAFLLLSIMFLAIDVWNIWSGAPLFYAGMNPILLYVGHEICEEFFPFSWQPYTQTHAELLIMNIWGMSLWILISYFLFRKKIFLSI